MNEFVLDRRRLSLELRASPQAHRELRFSRGCLAEVQREFAGMIWRGEERLHQFAGLLCSAFLSSYHVQSVVIGEVETTRERFTLSQHLSPKELFATTDIDLGSRQLSKLRYFDGEGWSRAQLVANVVEYQPTRASSHDVHRVITRIKAEEEIWNKGVDEIFELDRLVRWDKQLRHLSRYVKDIFGIKLVVGDVADVYATQRALEAMRRPAGQLEALGILVSPEAARLEFVEVKDCLPLPDRKRSGWAAMKSVVRWCDKTFEVQVQPLRNFHREREVLTRESHTSFKARRERMRDQVAELVPLFRFYRDLLRWLFLKQNTRPPV